MAQDNLIASLIAPIKVFFKKTNDQIIGYFYGISIKQTTQL